MSERGPGNGNNDLGSNGVENAGGSALDKNESVVQSTPDQRAYFDIVNPLYAERGKLQNELKGLSNTPENQDKIKQVKEGIRFTFDQENQARDDLLTGRISSFGEAGPRLTPSEAALNAKPELEISPTLAPRRTETESAEPAPVSAQPEQPEGQKPVEVVPPSVESAAAQGSVDRKKEIDQELEKIAGNPVKTQESIDRQKSLEEELKGLDAKAASAPRAEKPDVENKAEGGNVPVAAEGAPNGVEAPVSEQPEKQPTPEQKAIDDDRRKAEARLEELGRAQYQSAEIKAETERLKAQLAELDSGKLSPERQQEAAERVKAEKEATEKAEREKRDGRRREVESELEEIGKASYVTADLKAKQTKLEAELAGLNKEAGGREEKGAGKEEKIDYEKLVEETRDKQAAAYAAYRAGKKGKKSSEELGELLKSAEASKNSHYGLVAQHVSSLIEARSHELESDPDKENKLKAYKAELFNEYFIKEYERSQDKDIETFPPKEKGVLQKAVNWWMRQPKWKRLAISTGVSLAVGIGTGGIASIPAGLIFGGGIVMRRYISGGASVGARVSAELGLKTWDKVFGGEKKGLAYQERQMTSKFNPASVEEFIKAQQEYAEMRTLAEQREKRRRIGVLAAQVGAGVATSFILGHHTDAVAKALHLTQGEAALHGAALDVKNAAGHAETSVAEHFHPTFAGHNIPDHGSNLPPSPAEHVTGVVTPPSEVFTPSEYIQPMDGESVWNKVSDVLQSTKQFDALQSQLEASGLHGDALTQHLAAAKTYYIDAIKDRVVADPSKYIVDGKMNLSELFATPGGQTWLHETALRAEGLSQADVQNIMHNVAEAQGKAAEAVSTAIPHAAGSIGTAAPAAVEGVGASAPISYESWLSQLNNETLKPFDISSALSNQQMIDHLAQVKGVSPVEMQKALETALPLSVHTQEWLGKLDNGTLKSADITTALGSKEWVDRLAAIKGVPPTEMQKTLEDALTKSISTQEWLKQLDAGQLRSVDIEQTLASPGWIHQLADLQNVSPDKMHDILEQALNVANVKELFQYITSGQANEAAIKAAMGNTSWINEAAKINNTSVANIQHALQTAYEKASQAGK
ncbi:MAG: hypothetical protein KGJ01_00695 [Patescibacteria group bacterium]|nr:hypothetical protein [Patescibacteria group bacterium]